jgi:hypothetical protein
VLGRTGEESEPAWPEPNRAAEGAPNAVFVVARSTNPKSRPMTTDPVTPRRRDSAGAKCIEMPMRTTNTALVIVMAVRRRIRETERWR